MAEAESMPPFPPPSIPRDFNDRDVPPLTFGMEVKILPEGVSPSHGWVQAAVSGWTDYWVLAVRLLPDGQQVSHTVPRCYGRLRPYRRLPEDAEVTRAASELPVGRDLLNRALELLGLRERVVLAGESCLDWDGRLTIDAALIEADNGREVAETSGYSVIRWQRCPANSGCPQDLIEEDCLGFHADVYSACHAFLAELLRQKGEAVLSNLLQNPEEGDTL